MTDKTSKAAPADEHSGGYTPDESTTVGGPSGVLEATYPQGVGQPEGNREGQIDTSDEDGKELKERLDKEMGA